MRYQWLVWRLFAALMGFALGGSAFWGLYGPNATIHHAPQSQEHNAAESEAKTKKEETDEALAYYTLWLMVFTGILAAATLGLGVATFGLYLTGEKQIRHNAEAAAAQSRDMQASIRAAETAADAAMLSARAAIGMELPVIRVEQWPGLINVAQPPTPEMPYRGGAYAQKLGEFSVMTALQFKNFGRTPAFPIKVMTGWEVAEQPRPEPVYVNIVNSSPTAIVNPNESLNAAARLVVNLTVEEREALVNQEAYIWLYASLEYKDFLNTVHEARFCWRSRNGIFGAPTGQAPAAYSVHT